MDEAGAAGLVVATYNLWAFGEPWRYTAERGESRGAVPGSPAATLRLPSGIWPRRRALLSRVLEQSQPDLIGLQEIARDPITGETQAEQLAAELRYSCAVQPITTWEYGGCSLAVLSHHPIRSWQEIPAPTEIELAAMHAMVELPVGEIDFLVVHVTTRQEAQLPAAESLLSYIGALSADRPLIVVGDFNCVPESAPIQALTGGGRGQGRPLRDAWREANPRDPGSTMPSQSPVVRIDYILVGPGPAAVRAVRLGDRPDPDGFYPSDHLGVAAGLRFG